MKTLVQTTLDYQEKDKAILKMFESYNRVLRAVGIFLVIEFFMLVAII